MGSSQDPGNEKCKHGVGRSSVSAFEGYKLNDFRLQKNGQRMFGPQSRAAGRLVLQETTVNVESYCDVVTVKSSRQKKTPWAVCERYSVSAKMVGESCAQGFGGET